MRHYNSQLYVSTATFKCKLHCILTMVLIVSVHLLVVCMIRAGGNSKYCRHMLDWHVHAGHHRVNRSPSWQPALTHQQLVSLLVSTPGLLSALN